MKKKETLSPIEKDDIKGGFWVELPDGSIVWIPDDEGSEDPFIMW